MTAPPTPARYKFMTIREVARTGLISEHYLRLLEKQHRLPCVYSGKKCLVNYPLLVEQLDAESAAAAGMKSAPTRGTNSDEGK